MGVWVCLSLSPTAAQGVFGGAAAGRDREEGKD
jgi:hypothetical protein